MSGLTVLTYRMGRKNKLRDKFTEPETSRLQDYFIVVSRTSRLRIDTDVENLNNAIK